MSKEMSSQEREDAISKVASEILTELKEENGVEYLSELHPDPPFYSQPEVLIPLVGFLVVITMIVKGGIFFSRKKQKKKHRKEEEDFRDEVRAAISNKSKK